MKMKVVLVSVLIASFLILPFVSAFELPPIRTFMESVVTSVTDIFEPIFQVMLGGQNYTGAFLFEKVLVFTLLLALVYVVLGKIPMFEDLSSVRWVFAIIVPLLGVRYMQEGWLTTIFTQYQILSIVLATVLPFILYFYFLYTAAGDHGIIRKLGWLIFVGIYVGLWSTAQGNSDMYLWTFIAALVCLLGDDIIKNRFEATQRYKTNRYAREGDLATIRRQIKQISEDITNGITPAKIGQENIKILERHHKWISNRF